MNLVLRRWRGRNLRADNTSAIVVMIDPMGPNVCKSIEKMAALADDTRAKGKKFCARTHNKVGYNSFPFIFLMIFCSGYRETLEVNGLLDVNSEF